MNLTKVVQNEYDKRFIESRKIEHNGIVEKGGVRVVSRSAIPRNANFVGNRFILSIKDPVMFDERYTA